MGLRKKSSIGVKKTGKQSADLSIRMVMTHEEGMIGRLESANHYKSNQLIRMVDTSSENGPKNKSSF